MSTAHRRPPPPEHDGRQFRRNRERTPMVRPTLPPESQLLARRSSRTGTRPPPGRAASPAGPVPVPEAVQQQRSRALVPPSLPPTHPPPEILTGPDGRVLSAGGSKATAHGEEQPQPSECPGIHESPDQRHFRDQPQEPASYGSGQTRALPFSSVQAGLESFRGVQTSHSHTCVRCARPVCGYSPTPSLDHRSEIFVLVPVL